MNDQTAPDRVAAEATTETAQPLAGRPTREAERIASLDVLRGFALLGILLLNILGFGLLFASYSNAGFDVSSDASADLVVWAGVELFAEGAMRCLFSILFGAGVVLFASGARRRGAWLHYRRTFWLLVFGLVDAYLLLWSGDILVTYALAGAVLYWLRNLRARWLLALTGLLLAGLVGFYALVGVGLGQAREAALTVSEAADPDQLPPGTLAAAQAWNDLEADFQPSPEAVEEELAARRGGYLSAFSWNLDKTNEMLGFVMPMFLFWDALVMMLLGMALFKLGVLQGERSRAFYVRLAAVGFALGLAINGYEVFRVVRSDFDFFRVFAQIQPTYQLGRLGVALGWLGVVVLFATGGGWQRLRRMLASVGRTALTNYLLQSAIALFLFTGVGLGLVGRMSRAELYPVVVVIWVFQLLVSDWWMRRYRFGPLEWLWRWLTYGRRPPLRREALQ
ncbi:MAG: DUF418 domain-containing protein [Acidobacteria bacterium]|nr:MAG: DUF418 domain-containing protein [Acidobacteriota bacterium]REK10571.1 MAG: DUF418 domain-containing protein [Acidobacteriota bacterium]